MRRERHPEYEQLLKVLPPTCWMARDERVTIRLIQARDAVHAAGRAFIEAQNELEAAVHDSFEAGDSWRTIGFVLGVSGQAAQQRFGRRQQS